MGLRPLDVAQWLEIDEHYGEELELKTTLLTEAFDEVVATNPEGDEASAELLEERASSSEFETRSRSE